MLVLLVLVLLLAAAVAWSRHGHRGPVRIRSCCARQWPPDDLTGREPGR